VSRAQQLFHRRAGQLWVGDQLLPLVAVGEQGIDAVADHVYCGLVAGVEQLHTAGDQLVLGQPVALVFGFDQPGDQVVGRRAPPLFDQVAEVKRRTPGWPGPPGAPARGVRPSSYMATIACDQRTRWSLISTGTPNMRAMVTTGTGVA
jgi:hypothetical protein